MPDIVYKGQKIQLTPTDFIAQGGEGITYGKGDYVYKIALDPLKVMPMAKMDELAVLSYDNIMRPLDFIYDKRGKVVIGHVMEWCQSDFPIAALFSNRFKKKRKIDLTILSSLLESIQETTVRIHERGCLIVDGNEYNYLVHPVTWSTAFFIDVDSYQTSSFPATAIKPNIQDPHTPTFSELTDWFSFGIIICQLFTGMHPYYDGDHPRYHSDMNRRMLANASIFGPDISLAPGSDLGLLPSEYRTWMEKVFEKGKRLPPPHVAGSLQLSQVTTHIVQGSDQFVIEEVRDYGEEVLSHWQYGGRDIVETANYWWLDDYKRERQGSHALLFNEQLSTFVYFGRDSHNKLKVFTDRTDIKVISPALSIREVMVVYGQPFVVQKGKIVLLGLSVLGATLVVTVTSSWKILPNSFIGEEVLSSDILGVPCLHIPASRSCRSSHIPELVGCKIAAVRRMRNVVVVLATKEGETFHYILKFTDSFDKYVARKDVTPYNELNFVVLDTGLVVRIAKGGRLELFRSSYDHKEISIIEDRAIETTMQLSNRGSVASFFRDSRLYTIKAKKG